MHGFDFCWLLLCGFWVCRYMCMPTGAGHWCFVVLDICRCSLWVGFMCMCCGCMRLPVLVTGFLWCTSGLFSVLCDWNHLCMWHPHFGCVVVIVILGMQMHVHACRCWTTVFCVVVWDNCWCSPYGGVLFSVACVADTCSCQCWSLMSCGGLCGVYCLF